MRREVVEGGFTILEVLLACAAFVIVLGAIMLVYELALKTETETGLRTSLQDGLQVGMLNFEQEISNATGAVVPDLSSSQSLTIWEPVYDSSGDLTTDDDEVTFTASGNKLLESVAPGQTSTRSAITDKVLLWNLPDPYPSPGLFTYYTRTNGNMQSTTPDQATVVRADLLETGTYSVNQTTVGLSEDIRMGNR